METQSVNGYRHKRLEGPKHGGFESHEVRAGAETIYILEGRG